MSKYYDKYLELKEKDSKTMYLFKKGCFYIFLGEDAIKINDYLVLKITKFTKEIDKCGFPESELNNYLRLFNNHHLKYKIIDKIETKTFDELLNFDINKITPLDALEILKKIKELNEKS